MDFLEIMRSRKSCRSFIPGKEILCRTKEILDDPDRSLAIDLFMKHPIEAVKKMASEKIKLVEADGKA